jgi:hypothetical protein
MAEIPGSVRERLEQSHFGRVVTLNEGGIPAQISIPRY